MIYFLAYVLLGISTTVYALFLLRGEQQRAVHAAVMGLVWPVVWVMAMSNSIRGLNTCKCAWCGSQVGTQYNLEAWRLHYLDECDKHPLAVKARRLENYLDELDAKYTDYRTRLEMTSATLYLTRNAIKGILANPQGCPMCDAGVLRNPDKKHWPDCPYEIARAALALYNEGEK